MKSTPLVLSAASQSFLTIGWSNFRIFRAIDNFYFSLADVLALVADDSQIQNAVLCQRLRSPDYSSLRVGCQAEHFTPVDINTAFVFWHELAMRGNENAQALVLATDEKPLLERAQDAFAAQQGVSFDPSVTAALTPKVAQLHPLVSARTGQ